MTSRFPKNLVLCVVFLYIMIHLWLLIVLTCLSGNNQVNQFFEFLTKSFNPEQTSNDNNALMDNMLRTMTFEGGNREKAYLDSEGYPTIGVGHLLEKKKYEIPEGEDETWVPEKFRDITWTEEQGKETFYDDYLNMQQDVSRRYGEDEFSSLPMKEQGILTDLAFNLGAEGLFGGAESKGFPGFLEDFREGRYGEAAKELQYKNPDKDNFEESDWWDQIGGDTTEERIAKGEWSEGDRKTNRATATFDLLTSLMNK